MSELSDLNPEAPPLGGGGQPDPIGDMRKLGANLAVSSKAAEKPPVPTEFTQKADGSVTIKGDRQLMEYYGKAGQFYQQAMGGMQQQVDRLKQQEDAARNQPAWVQLATALSANMAQQKDMPGWVRGLGQTAAQLNPRPEQLAAQRMGLMDEQANLAGKAAGLEMSAMGHRQAAEDKKAMVAEKAKEDLTRVEKDASVGARTRGDFDSATYIAEMVSKGQDPREAVATAARLEGVSKITRSRLEAEGVAKTAAEAQKTKQFYDALQASSDKTDKMIAAGDKRAADTAARGEIKTSASDAAKAAKAAEPSPVLRKQLADLNAADNALEEIEKLVNDPKNQGFFTGQGPGSGRLAAGLARAGADPGGRIAGLKQKLGLQTAQAIKATGAGARGFGPQERPYFQQLAEGMDRTPAQNLQVIKGWREFLDVERRGIQVANPDVAWDGKYAPTLGKRLAPGAASASAPSAKKKLVFNPDTGKVEEK